MEWSNQDYVIQLKMERGNLLRQMINGLLAFLLLWVSTGCQSNQQHISQVQNLPFYNTPDFTPKWIDEKEPPSFHQIADFSFVNQNGEEITQNTFSGKIYVADFIFTTCPGICPKMTGNMSKLQAAIKDDPDVLLLSHSVTPKMDSVSVLKTYAKQHGAIDGKWHIVTGDRKAIYTIARKSYFADENLGLQKTENDFLHTENFILIDKHRRIRGVYNGVLPAEMTRLLEDIKLLKSKG